MAVERVLEASSTVGACISILFSFCTVAVLACFRDKSHSTLIKQQFAISIMVTNAIMIAGFQGGISESSCHVVTILLLYCVTASFAWLMKDISYIATCVRWDLPTQEFRNVCLLIWGLPLLSIVLALLLGFLIKSSIGFKAYSCWKSDHVIWAWIIPCFILIGISVYWITFIIVKLAKMKDSGDSTKLFYLPPKAIKYNLTTNVTLLVMNTFIWVVAAYVFYDPKGKNYLQLVLGLGHAGEGLFLFFLFCIFNTRENGIYSLREVKEPVQKRSAAQDTCCTKVQEEEKVFKSTVAPAPGELDEPFSKDIPTSNNKHDSSDNSENNVHVTPPELCNTTATTETMLSTSIYGKDDLPQPYDDPVVVENNHFVTKQDHHVASNIHNFEDFINASMATYPVRSSIRTSIEEEDDPHMQVDDMSTAVDMSAPPDPVKKNDSYGDFKYTSRLSSASSQSGFGMATRSQCSSRNSSTSFTSMNELESLFNNPDLMNGGYSRNFRLIKDQETNKKGSTHKLLIHSNEIPSENETAIKQKPDPIKHSKSENSLINNTDPYVRFKDGKSINSELYVLDELNNSHETAYTNDVAKQNDDIETGGGIEFELSNNSNKDIEAQVLGTTQNHEANI